MTHTPTPWRIGKEGKMTRKNGSKWKVWNIIGISLKGHNMATCSVMVDPFYLEEEDEQKANAEFIVRACNAHDELLDALKAITKIAWHRESAGSPSLSNESRWEVVRLARDAIAKAEAK